MSRLLFKTLLMLCIRLLPSAQDITFSGIRLTHAVCITHYLPLDQNILLPYQTAICSCICISLPAFSVRLFITCCYIRDISCCSGHIRPETLEKPLVTQTCPCPQQPPCCPNSALASVGPSFVAPMGWGLFLLPHCFPASEPLLLLLTAPWQTPNSPVPHG